MTKKNRSNPRHLNDFSGPVRARLAELHAREGSPEFVAEGKARIRAERKLFLTARSLPGAMFYIMPTYYFAIIAALAAWSGRSISSLSIICGIAFTAMPFMMAWPRMPHLPSRSMLFGPRYYGAEK